MSLTSLLVMSLHNMVQSLPAMLASALPNTGGDGPLIVTAIGVSMAALSLIIIFLRWKSSRKQKGKPRQ